jgi:hypothetical protein
MLNVTGPVWGKLYSVTTNATGKVLIKGTCFKFSTIQGRLLPGLIQSQFKFKFPSC